jgi:DNA-binding beta-propeller fold protein YncE
VSRSMLRLSHNSTAKFRRLLTWTLAGLLTLSLAPNVYGGKKKKGQGMEIKEETAASEPAIDTSKLVWPRPPDIARIRWLQQFRGERVPAEPLQPVKKRQGWMDRLAGVKQMDEIRMVPPHVLIEPYGVAADSKGNIYVADTYVGAIFIFNPETDNVEFIHNGKDVHFEQIIGLAMDEDDRLFVSDSHLRTVFVFDAAHRLVGSFGQESLERPSGIAIDTRNRFLYVADVVKDHIAVFDADRFKLLRTIGGPPAKVGDEDAGTFARPTNVAVDANGNVYVADTLNDRIQVFDAEGNFISMFGRAGDGPGAFGRPKGLAVDRDGHIWVADTSMDRVQVFDREGRLAGFFGMHGTLPGQFILPTGIAIDKQNRVLVSEQFKGRVQVFRYITDAEAATEKAGREKKASMTSSQQSSPGGTEIKP